MASLFDKHRRDIQGIVWAAISVFLLLMLVSFSPQDPSFNSSIKAFSFSGATYRHVSNFCGIVGSYSADIFLQAFGITAFVLVPLSLRASIRSFRGEPVSEGALSLGWPLLLLLTLSALISTYFPEARFFKNAIVLGGIAGLTASRGLTVLFNKYGALVILWSLASVLLIYYSRKPLKEILGQPAQQLFMRLKAGIEKAKNALFAGGLFSKTQPLVMATESAGAGPGALLGATGLSGRAAALIDKIGTRLEDKNSESSVEEDKHMDLVASGAGGAEEEEEDSGEGSALKRIFISSRKTNANKPALPEAVKKVRKVENWELPKLSLLEMPPLTRIGPDNKFIKRNVEVLEDKLSQFSVKGKVVAVKPGPAVTMYEFKPNADVKISKITELADDLSLALSAESLRIIAPLPGRDVVGIETSNPTRETVYLREVLEESSFWDEKNKLPVALGKQADGEPRVEDLRRMPHLLVAGTTGSGKSVFVNSCLTGLLFRHSPKTLRLILVDPKQVDLAAFHKIPHLIMPPVKEARRAVLALKWAVKEMDKRYRSMSKFDARGLEEFNQKVENLAVAERNQHAEINQKLEQTARHESYYYQSLPYIVVVVEEFGDLMAVDKVNVEQCVVRLAQMARACGIHLILAMQSPRKDVVTGLIKTNIPGRISFKVASKTDSRIILDESGAERLLARGDMLFLAPGVSKPQRQHASWISENEISAIAKFWAEQADPDFDRHAMKLLEGGPSLGGASSGGGAAAGDSLSSDDFSEEGGDNEFDEKYDEILAWVAGQKEVSASLLQRRYHLGYPRAARMIEIFEKEGVVGPANGSKPRQVLVNKL